MHHTRDDKQFLDGLNEEIQALSARLANLQRAAKSVAALVKEPARSSKASQARVKPLGSTGLTIEQRLLQVLQTNPGAVFSTRDLAQKAGTSNVQSARNALARMRDAGQVERTDDGWRVRKAASSTLDPAKSDSTDHLTETVG